MKKRRIWKLRLSCQGCLGIPGGLWTPQENFYYPNADKTPPGGELVRIEWKQETQDTSSFWNFWQDILPVSWKRNRLRCWIGMDPFGQIWNVSKIPKRVQSQKIIVVFLGTPCNFEFISCFLWFSFWNFYLFVDMEYIVSYQKVLETYWQSFNNLPVLDTIWESDHFSSQTDIFRDSRGVPTDL